MGFSNSPFMECPNPNKVTQAQTNAIDKLWEEHYNIKLTRRKNDGKQKSRVTEN